MEIEVVKDTKLELEMIIHDMRFMVLITLLPVNLS